MFNKLLDVCEEKNGGKVGFTKAESLPQGTGVKDLEVITHSLFYLRRHGKTLKNAGCVLGSSIDVDSFFDSGNARRTFPHKLDRQKLMEICTNLRNVYDGTWLRRNVWKWLKQRWQMLFLVLNATKSIYKPQHEECQPIIKVLPR